MQILGPVSISDKTFILRPLWVFYLKILWSLEAARFVLRIVLSLCNLKGTSAALLPRWLWNFKVRQQFKVPISWLPDFTQDFTKRRVIGYWNRVQVAKCYKIYLWSRLSYILLRLMYTYVFQFYYLSKWCVLNIIRNPQTSVAQVINCYVNKHKYS